MLNARAINAAVFILTLLAFLPFVKTSPLSSDTQPHFVVAFSMAFVFFIAYESRLIVQRKALLVSIFFAALGMLLGGGAYEVMAPIFILLVYSFYRRYGGACRRPLYLAVCTCVVLYSLAMLVEMFGMAELIAALVSNVRKTENRGLVSLASEPSFYGLVSIAQLVVLEAVGGRLKRYFQALALVGLMMCQSLAVIVPAIMIIGLYLFHKKQYVLLIVTGVTVTMGLIIVSGMEGRAAHLINIAILGNGEIMADVSGANRLARSLVPLFASFTNGFLPLGFSDVPLNLQRINLSFAGLGSAGDVERLSNLATFFIYGFGYLAFPLVIMYFAGLIRMRTPLYLWGAIGLFLTINISLYAPFVLVVLASPYFMVSAPKKDGGSDHCEMP